uniref:Uncharacterized protein n=1 Tax=Glossina pallidipes TaxID=7398 RepID=A0A1A9ZRF6_GLOPL
MLCWKERGRFSYASNARVALNILIIAIVSSLEAVAPKAGTLWDPDGKTFPRRPKPIRRMLLVKPELCMPTPLSPILSESLQLASRDVESTDCVFDKYGIWPFPNLIQDYGNDADGQSLRFRWSSVCADAYPVATLEETSADNNCIHMPGDVLHYRNVDYFPMVALRNLRMLVEKIVENLQYLGEKKLLETPVRFFSRSPSRYHFEMHILKNEAISDCNTREVEIFHRNRITNILFVETWI